MVAKINRRFEISFSDFLGKQESIFPSSHSWESRNPLFITEWQNIS
jgi:hypothetical protein